MLAHAVHRCGDGVRKSTTKARLAHKVGSSRSLDRRCSAAGYQNPPSAFRSAIRAVSRSVAQRWIDHPVRSTAARHQWRPPQLRRGQPDTVLAFERP